jgi:hypothetical protein
MTKQTKATKPAPITFEELMSELDKYRPTRSYKVLTQQQIALISKCRDSDRPIPYPKICEMWKQLWDEEVRPTTIRGWYDDIQRKAVK